MALDTLSIAREIEAAGVAKPAAEAIAHGIGQGAGDERLRDVERGLGEVRERLGILTRMTGALMLLVVGAGWQLFTLSGNMARLDERMEALASRLPQAAVRP